MSSVASDSVLKETSVLNKYTVRINLFRTNLKDSCSVDLTTPRKENQLISHYKKVHFSFNCKKSHQLTGEADTCINNCSLKCQRKCS
jgi:hypothetical protein